MTKLTESIERRLWNVAAGAVGWVMAPVPYRVARTKPRLFSHYLRWREEKNLDIATRLMGMIGLGATHRRRVEKLSMTIFGEPTPRVKELAGSRGGPGHH